jgi:excisionase family DNA binding protein
VDEALLTVTEVSERLKVDEETVRRWLRRGELIGIRLGGGRSGWRVDPADLAQFVQAKKVAA